MVHRFKPGTCGNPSGRPRSSVSKLLRDVLDADEHKYTKRIVQTLVARAGEGRLPAIKTLLAFAEPRQQAPDAHPAPGRQTTPNGSVDALVREAINPPEREPA